jgi:hypothetical protein
MPLLRDEDGDDFDHLFLAGETRMMMNALRAKAEALARAAESVEALLLGKNAVRVERAKDMPRFLRFLAGYSIEPQQGRQSNPVVFKTVRQLFQAKITCDQWHKRMGRPLMRFPEFILAWHYKDGDKMFPALQRCARLWRGVAASEAPELRLFRKFALEKFTTDEMSFFLALWALVVPDSPSDENLLIVSFTRARQGLEKLLGKCSPVVQMILTEVGTFVKNGSIDFGDFGLVTLKFYQNERRKRRGAVRLMFQSQKFTTSDNRLTFENFAALLQSLGFHGSIDELFELFREASWIARGDVTADALLTAMDNLSFHFSTIETLDEGTFRTDTPGMSRAQITGHWTRFCSWFEGFNEVNDSLDLWVLATMSQRMHTVETLVKSQASVPMIYDEFRNLLDCFQFMLGVLAKSQKAPMKATKAEKQLNLLENLIDLLVTYVVHQDGARALFTEFEEAS